MNELAIEVLGLKKEFLGHRKGPWKRASSVKALQGVNFRVKRGENYCLLGPNGSGKTTLIRCILGLLEAEGSINLMGYEIPKERKHVVSKIGYMPQDVSLYPDLSVKETMNFFGRLYGIKKRKDLNQAVNKSLELFLFKEWQNTIAENLSGGMKRRLSLACALIHDPVLVFLDEPTIGVDPNLRLSFWDYFNDLTKKGVTIITTTHVMDEAEKSHLIGFMRKGKLIAEGTSRDLKRNVPGSRKLIIRTEIEDTKKLAQIIKDEFNLKSKTQEFKLEIFYDDDSIVGNILTFVKERVKILSIHTTEPSLEDTFIFFSNKDDSEGIK